jgi:hypothetical protein
VAGGPFPSGLADVIDTILDKGLVIDAYARVSLIGIEILTVDARVVVAGVDTYLRFAEAVNRLDLAETKEPGLPEMVQGAKQEEIGDKSMNEVAGGRTDGRPAWSPRTSRCPRTLAVWGRSRERSRPSGTARSPRW